MEKAGAVAFASLQLSAEHKQRGEKPLVSAIAFTRALEVVAAATEAATTHLVQPARAPACFLADQAGANRVPDTRAAAWAALAAVAQVPRIGPTGGVTTLQPGRVDVWVQTGGRLGGEGGGGKGGGGEGSGGDRGGGEGGGGDGGGGEGGGGGSTMGDFLLLLGLQLAFACRLGLRGGSEGGIVLEASDVA